MSDRKSTCYTGPGATHSHACDCREEKFRRMAEALRALRGESKCALRAGVTAGRYYYGNPDWRCLEMALKLAEAALKEFDNE